MGATTTAAELLDAAGACTADDGTKTASAAFSCNSIQCAKTNFFRLDSTAKCIASANGISAKCADCFGQVAQCTLKHCGKKAPASAALLASPADDNKRAVATTTAAE